MILTKITTACIFCKRPRANLKNSTIQKRLNKKFKRFISFNERPRLSKNHALIYHNLSTLLEAGLPILRALKTASQGLQGKASETLTKIAEDVSKGADLTEAMSKHKHVFKPLDLTLIKAGEHSGNLDRVFDTLSNWHYFQLKLKRIIISGMALPVLLIIVAAFLAPIPFLFLDDGGILSYIMDALEILALFCMPIIVILAVIVLTPKQGVLRKALDEFVLLVPVLGKALKALSLSRYCNCFAMLFTAGVPITECAEISAQCVGNAVMADWLKGGAQSAKQGNSIHKGFSRRLDFEFLNLWEVGEDSGELDNTALHMGQNYAYTAEFLLTDFVKWLAKIAYAFVCAIILFKVFQGYAKIFSSTTPIP